MKLRTPPFILFIKIVNKNKIGLIRTHMKSRQQTNDAKSKHTFSYNRYFLYSQLQQLHSFTYDYSNQY